MSAVVDVLGVALRVGASIVPDLIAAIEHGASGEILSASLRSSIAVAHEAASARIDAHAGRPTSRARVEALRLDDAASRLRAIGHAAYADICADIARQLRDGDRGEETAT